MSNGASSGSITFPGLLLLTFIILKLCNVITWSWWWVLSPFWIPLAILTLYTIIKGTKLYIKGRKANKKLKAMTQDFPQALKSKWEKRMDDLRKQHEQKQAK